MRNSEFDEALGYWTVGIQYLHLVETVANETIQQGNQFVVVSDDEISLERYASETKWSDHSLVVPLLFDFYHGIEVLLKGFLASKGKLEKKNHKLSDLLKRFEELFPNHSLSTLLSRYIAKEKLPEPLASFCSQSSISIDDYYQALKYPESTNGAIYRHTPLKYRSNAGLPFFKGLVIDIKQVRLDAVALGRSICAMA
ncbi:MAG: HEPN domain-containing protein [Methylobacter sp.]|jgi:HEPN domain-containing protein|uniref:HEPN domain-containing protein n=1 Tax=unclassified Methylobacter TaxID=2635283 RepID=UPI0013767867|nr:MULTISPECIES: HEPN domain-containing protein [unclassified Methylobacter]MCL7420219.1 HEPN domain-containing protein [Methylobacter sp.]